MGLPLEPPLAPMLGRLVRELPTGDFAYEPKWDGFRCLAFRSGDAVDLRSRHDRPLARYFPEVVAALRRLDEQRLVLDGELVVAAGFTTLMARLHPAASRVELLSASDPATLMAFDLLAVGDTDLRARPFAERRALLETVVPADDLRLRLTPATADPELAATWLDRGDGVDGVMAKPRDLPYEEGRRALLKVKRERTLDCVVAGFRLLPDRPLPSSLLLGLHDARGALRHIGVAGSFSERLRRELLAELRPLVTSLAGHPWERGFLTEGGPMGRLKGAAGRWDPDRMTLDWLPVTPTHVAEVSYDHVDEDRLRHPARFRRWRADRDAASCTFDQLGARAGVTR